MDTYVLQEDGSLRERIKGLEDWQYRVINEQTAVEHRLVKLNLFIDSDAFKAIDQQDQWLLLDQRDYMQRYLEVLEKRIDRFLSKGD